MGCKQHVPGPREVTELTGVTHMIIQTRVACANCGQTISVTAVNGRPIPPPSSSGV